MLMMITNLGVSASQRRSEGENQSHELNVQITSYAWCSENIL